MGEVVPIRDRRKAGHLTSPVDIRMARLIARSLQLPGRHGFWTFFKEFMYRGYEAARRLPKSSD